MDVFTCGGTFSPRSTAFLASSPAASISPGLDVLVQEVMAAMRMLASFSFASWLKPSTGTGTPAGECMETVTSGDSFLP